MKNADLCRYVYVSSSADIDARSQQQVYGSQSIQATQDHAIELNLPVA